jgi:aminoglycoside phosphotransferase (APT) family kinase protein
VVKYPAGPPSHPPARDLSRELFVYRVASWNDGLAAALARPIFIDEARQVLVVEFLGAPAADWPARSPAFPITVGEVATTLAAAMAKWHAATHDVSCGPSLAEGVLSLPDNLEQAVADRALPARRFMTELVDDTEIATLLAETKDAVRRRCLIHGDIRPDNWMFETNRGKNSIKLLDWEMAGSGDPLWDVASALAESVVQGIRDNLDWRPSENGWPGIVEAVAPRFLRSYRSAGGADIDERAVVLFMAARMLHIATEWMDVQTEPEGDGAAAPLLAVARALWRRSGKAAIQLAHWSV